MSDSPESRCAIEKQTKKSQDVEGSSSKAKRPHARKIVLCPPPPVPSDEEEEELPLQIHSPIEHTGSRRTLVYYMREDSRSIITQRNTHCYDSDKVGLDPRFWSYFHADWYRSVYESKQTLAVPMQWIDWAFLEKHKKDCPAFRDVIEMCEYHGLKKIIVTPRVTKILIKLLKL
jgi:hypothetical protein